MANTKNNWTHVSTKEFSTIKQLLANNLSKSQVASLVGRSWGTIQLIDNSEDLNSYKQLVREQRQQYRRESTSRQDAVEAPSSTTPFTATVTDNNLENRKVVALERIADSLDKIVEGKAKSRMRLL